MQTVVTLLNPNYCFFMILVPGMGVSMFKSPPPDMCVFQVCAVPPFID